MYPILNRLQAAWKWFRTNVMIFTFIAGVTAAVFAVLNYFNQSPNRAELASTPNAKAESRRVILESASVGRKMVQRGAAALFAFDLQSRKRGAELGKTRIEGLGTSAYSLNALFNDIEIATLPLTLLVCTEYFDENNRHYNQAFLYGRARSCMQDILIWNNYHHQTMTLFVLLTLRTFTLRRFRRPRRGQLLLQIMPNQRPRRPKCHHLSPLCTGV